VHARGRRPASGPLDDPGLASVPRPWTAQCLRVPGPILGPGGLQATGRGSRSPLRRDRLHRQGRRVPYGMHGGGCQRHGNPESTCPRRKRMFRCMAVMHKYAGRWLLACPGRHRQVRCPAPAEMAHFETARFCSPSSDAYLCRLAFPGGCVMFSRFPAAARLPQAGSLSAVSSSRRLQARAGIRTRNRTPPRNGTPLGMSPAAGPRPACLPGRALRKEITPCGTSREEPSGQTS
jgi:hypothetical protein